MSVFTRQMIEQAVEAEYGDTFIHWRHEFDLWLGSELRKLLDESNEVW